MKSVIIGTAGHIDHGKTALVRALTGIDADRLEEEKRRGITIDIGFAHLELPSPDGGEPLRLGFVDVPGHERFVRNMLAGIGGIDVVMLVIAADESIRPQTREHFDICRMLNIRRGITVLTKSDMVDGETLEVVRLEVAEFLRGSFLEDAPILAVSSKTGVGIEGLKQELARTATAAPARDTALPFRLPIDRVFTIKGFGTVVTGTLLSGTVEKEHEAVIYPEGRRVRVRGVQVHGTTAESAKAGERTALNLTGVDVAEMSRGMTLAEADVFRAVKRFDAKLTLLPSARALGDRTKVHLHVHTSETIAQVRWLEELAAVEPGGTAFAQISVADPLVLVPGDRFILRQFSPVVTIGGGQVLDIAPQVTAAQWRRLRRKDAEAGPKHLALLDSEPPVRALEYHVGSRAMRGLPVEEAAAIMGMRQSAVAELARQFPCLKIGGLLFASREVERAEAPVLEMLKKFHNSNALATGMNRRELTGRLTAELRMAPEFAEFMLGRLAEQKKIDLAGELVRMAGRKIVMKDDEAESKKQIELAFASAGLKVPALKEVLAGLKVDRARAQQIVTLLLRDRVLVKVSEDLVFHRDALEKLKKDLLGLKAASPKIDVSRFKELTGVSRKYAIPLLEYLDRERVTRRLGDERVIL